MLSHWTGHYNIECAQPRAWFLRYCLPTADPLPEAAINAPQSYQNPFWGCRVIRQYHSIRKVATFNASIIKAALVVSRLIATVNHGNHYDFFAISIILRYRDQLALRIRANRNRPGRDYRDIHKQNLNRPEVALTSSSDVLPPGTACWCHDGLPCFLCGRRRSDHPIPLLSALLYGNICLYRNRARYSRGFTHRDDSSVETAGTRR